MLRLIAAVAFRKRILVRSYILDNLHETFVKRATLGKLFAYMLYLLDSWIDGFNDGISLFPEGEKYQIKKHGYVRNSSRYEDKMFNLLSKGLI